MLLLIVVVLESISIPKSVIISRYAFFGCLHLIYVNIFDDENKQFHFKYTTVAERLKKEEAIARLTKVKEEDEDEDEDGIIEYGNNEIITDNIKSIVKRIFNVKEKGEEGNEKVVKFIPNRMTVLFDKIEEKKNFPPGIINKILEYKY